MMTDDLFPTQGQVDELLRVNQSLQEAWVWQVVRNRRSSLARSARNVVKQLHLHLIGIPGWVLVWVCMWMWVWVLG